MSLCPTPETLCRLACDSSGGSQFAGIEAHVQACAHCQQVLERLASDASVSEGHGPARPMGPERAAHVNHPYGPQSQRE